jgi:SAM-dependent methyltransferase
VGVLSVPGLRRGGWDEQAFFATGDAEIEHVLSLAAGLRPLGRTAALDFGCGVGRLTRALGRRFSRAVGVDISEVMVARASHLNRQVPACEFRLNLTPDLAQLETDSFDFVYSNLVLQHLPSAADIERYMAEFVRVAKPAGLVVFGLIESITAPYSLQPRRRLYTLLRRLGVSEDWMLRRTPLTPMRMTAVPEPRVRAFVGERGAEVLLAESLVNGPVRYVRYYVSPSAR